MTADRSAREQQLAAALAALEQRLSRACAQAGRDRQDVVLVAVTKTHPLSDVAALAALGVRDVGENRDQEAAPKARARPDLRWHFVGALQSNKAASVASYASVVHSVDRASLVRALGVGAVRAGRQVDVLLQVSLDGDPARAGAFAADVPALAEATAGTQGLRLAGVMTVAPLGVEPARAFAQLAEVAARLRAEHPQALTISAGMSGDLEPAIAAGATCVRVGTALLGLRAPLSQ